MSLNKSHILFTLQEHLYEDAKHKLLIIYQEIHTTHQRLTENSSGGFWFKGMRYKTNLRGAAQSLHPALSEFMEDYLIKSEAIKQEVAYVNSYLQAVLNQCKEEAHLYCWLPTTLHSILQNEGVNEIAESPLIIVSDLDFNQKGKELLFARMMLNMTGT